MVNWLGALIQGHITEQDTVLDLGCGIMQATDDLKAKFILGVDVWSVYLDKIKHLHPTVELDMSETYRFMDNSYDVVICLDVVEHLPKQLALQVLDECKRICRKFAIIYTPTEFKTNEQPEDGAWGMGYNPHQSHQCVLEKWNFITRGYELENPMGDGFLGVYSK